MRLFAPALAFVDLETTGTTAATDAITEIGIVRVECRSRRARAAPRHGVEHARQSRRVHPARDSGADRASPTRWSATRRRSRASRTRSRHAPPTRCSWRTTPASTTASSSTRSRGSSARSPRACSARSGCRGGCFRTSRGTTWTASSRGTRCPSPGGTARSATRACCGRSCRRSIATSPPEAIEAAAKRVLKTPSLPPQLAPDALDALPEAPGVYLFYGLNALPLYIGKSTNLRERVGAHFSSDYRSATDLRLSSGAPAHRVRGDGGRDRRAAARGRARQVDASGAQPRAAPQGRIRRARAAGRARTARASFPPRASSPASSPAGSGRSRRSGRRARRCARSPSEHALCWKALGLEKRLGPCFARQVKRCAGACVGAESAGDHHERLRQALAPLAIPPWPFAGLAAIRERSLLGDRIDLHVIRDWCWLGTAQDEGELGRLVEAPPRPEFDADIARLLIRTLARGQARRAAACRPDPTACHG